MGLSDFERKLERGVEGFFGRVFRGGVRPVELGRKLLREMDAGKTVAVNGATLVPNDFVFLLAPDDHAQLADMEGVLGAELADLARSHARDEGYRLAGIVQVHLEVDDTRKSGLVGLESRYREPPPGSSTSSLVLPGGEHVPLGQQSISMGRQADCVIVLADPNASRKHAEIRAASEGFDLIDLGSTNGTRVNGEVVTTRRLAHGDLITIGNTVLRFQQD